MQISAVNVLFLVAAAVSPFADAWDCPCGSYCPNATLPYQHPVTCPVGYYCPEGLYLQQTFAVPCKAGYICPRAGLCTYLPTPCGFYAPQQSSAAQPCPAGTYSKGNSSECINCVPASSCPDSATCSPINTKTTTNLNIVKRPTSTTTPTPFKCGFYLPHGFPVLYSYEQPCRSGYYCPSGNTSLTPINPIKCPAGYYCGKEACHPSPCDCGYKCPAGSSAPIASQPPYYIPQPLATSQTLCPIGYKCDQPALCNATKCPNGTYVSCAGKKSCDPCPAGRYCPIVTKSVLCPAGYYCAAGSHAPKQCPANYYCPLGSSWTTACPGGKKSAPGAKSARACA